MYRLHHPLTNLNREKFHVIWSPPDIYTDRRPGDIVIGQRIAGHNTAWQEMCQDPNLLAVYDIDDNLLELDPANEVPYSIFNPVKDDTAVNISMANVVTVSTPKLADRIRLLNPNVVVLPNCLPMDWIGSVRHATDRIVVGWAGSMFHAQDWPGIASQLAIYAAKEPRAVFHTIGANYMSPIINARSSGWSTMDNYWHTMDFNIGIAPLSDTPFNSMKSWIKVLEYASQGIPAVASNIGQYPEFIEHGVNGFLVDDISEWPDYLLQLSNDDLREQMGEAAMNKALEFTIDKQVHRWEAVYEGAWL